MFIGCFVSTLEWFVHTLYISNQHRNKELKLQVSVVPVRMRLLQDGDEATRTLHRNLLLPIGALPLSDKTGEDAGDDDDDNPSVTDNTPVTDINIAADVAEDAEESVSESDDSDSADDEFALYLVESDKEEEELPQTQPGVATPQVDVQPVNAPRDVGQDAAVATQPTPVRDQPPAVLRRSNRNRRPPKWKRSGEYVCSQIATPQPVIVDSKIEIMKLFVASLDKLI